MLIPGLADKKLIPKYVMKVPNQLLHQWCIQDFVKGYVCVCVCWWGGGGGGPGNCTKGTVFVRRIRACATLFFPLYEVWGSPLDPPLNVKFSIRFLHEQRLV